MILDQQCQAARDRIAQFVNRSAAQHLRAWREKWGLQREARNKQPASLDASR